MNYNLGIVNLLVRDMGKARAFYTETLGLPVDEALSSPAFVTLRPAGGSLIALQDVKVLPQGLAGPPGGVELGLEVEDVDAAFASWKERGVETLTPPMDLPFGRTFVARDPEGHLLRVYRMKQGSQGSQGNQG